MGATYVDVTIRNPADLQRSWTGKFLVDIGAFDSLVPRAHLEEIGLKPKGQRQYVLADGNKVAFDITTAILSSRDRLSAARSSMGTKARSRCLASPHWTPVDSRSIRAMRNSNGCRQFC